MAVSTTNTNVSSGGGMKKKYERPTGAQPEQAYNTQGYPVSANTGTGAKFIPTSAQQGMANAKSTALINAEKAFSSPAKEEGYIPTRNNASTGGNRNTNAVTGATRVNVKQDTGNEEPEVPTYTYVSGGETAPAAAPSYNTTVPDAVAQYMQQAQTPTFDYNGQTPSFDYNGQPVQFSYDGQSPSFSYNGQAAQFQMQQADPELQKAYQNAMAALEQMKGQAPVYGSQYDDQIKSLYDQILGRGQFKYDSTTDPLYQQYVQDYTKGGQMAMQDTMGRAAALTGGYGSSYAQSVGQQQYDAYLQQLADVLPQTYGMALDAWNAQGDQLQKQFETARDMEQTDYDRYLNDVDKYYLDLDRAQNAADTAYDRMTKADETAYNRSVDAYDRDRLAEETAYGRATDQYERDKNAESTAYNRAMDQYDIARENEKTAYNRAADQYDIARENEKTAYDRAAEAYDRAVAADKTAYNRAMDERDLANEYLSRLEGLMALGYQPTAEDYARAGLSEAQGVALTGAYMPQAETRYVNINRDGDNNQGDLSDEELKKEFDAILASQNTAEKVAAAVSNIMKKNKTTGSGGGR